MAPTAGTDTETLFDAFLHPSRSLSRRGFGLFMGLLVVLSLSIGGVFLANGAWPIFGFYGLEILIIYIALRRSYRDGLIYEKVRLTDETLTVEKGDLRGRRESWRFQPYWVRVSMDDPPHHESQVVLTSHGQSLILGAFLSPEERLDFAKALRTALNVQRRPQGLFPVAEPS